MKYTFLFACLFAVTAAFAQGEPATKDSVNTQSPAALQGKPLLYLGDKEIVKDDLQKINPEDIESISVKKGSEAISEYGERAKDGVVIIKMKKTVAVKPE